jgi:hypothetical protein
MVPEPSDKYIVTTWLNFSWFVVFIVKIILYEKSC